jgi:hypothetical protein
MSFFISPNDRVSVTVDGGENVVWVRRKMDVATKARVQDALMAINGIRSDGAVDHVTMALTLNQQNTILLQNNILSWEGPMFRDEAGHAVPCTPEAIETIDPDHPLLEAILARLSELNKAPTQSNGAAGSPLAVAALSGDGKSGSSPKRSTPSR